MHDALSMLGQGQCNTLEGNSMRIRDIILCAAAVLIAVPIFAADLKPTKVTAAEAAGSIFKRPSAVHDERDGQKSITVELQKSGDGRFSSGMYSSDPSDIAFDAYPIDEFCYLISGQVTLTMADGSVLVINPGEAFTLPKGWKGRWQSTAYTKYYVVYGEGAQ